MLYICRVNNKKITMKTIYEKSIDYAEINEDENCNNSKNFDKFDIAKAFREGVECAEYWISVEDELPSIGDHILIKLKRDKLKIWRIFNEDDRILVSNYATHWRPIELR